MTRRGLLSGAALVAVALCSAVSDAAPPAASAAAPADSAAPVVSLPVAATTPASWPIAGGVSLRLSLPSGAAPMEGGLPALDLSQVQDAKVALQKGVARVVAAPEHVSDSVVAVCATAPAAHWSPELLPMVMDKLSSTAKAELAKDATIERFDDGTVVEVPGHHYEQKLTAEASLGKGGSTGSPVKVRMEGRQYVAFFGDGPDALACSVVCTELASETSRVCPAVVASLRLDGPIVPPPRASLPARLGFAIVRRPGHAAMVLLGGLLALVGLLVAVTRPRSDARRPSGAASPSSAR